MGEDKDSSSSSSPLSEEVPSKSPFKNNKSALLTPLPCHIKRDICQLSFQAGLHIMNTASGLLTREDEREEQYTTVQEYQRICDRCLDVLRSNAEKAQFDTQKEIQNYPHWIPMIEAYDTMASLSALCCLVKQHA